MSDGSKTATRDDATPTVLLVFPWCLDRLGHGNIQRVLAIAAYLSRHGVAVDLVYQGNPGVPSRERDLTGFRRIIRVDSWKSSDDARVLTQWQAFYSGYEPPPANLSAGTALTAVVRGLLEALPYTAVISSYVWTAPMFEGLSRRTLRIADVHDIISRHAARCAEATGTASPYFLPEETERFLWRQWDALLAITPDEADAMAPYVRPAQRILTVPHAVHVAPLGSPSSDAVVYTASDNPSNRAAVTWLLEQVWPRVLAVRPEARLRLVGLVCDAVRQTPLAATPNVDLIGFVERPIDELARASVCVAPYLYGSGLKIKVIEAAGVGRAVLTTVAGIEGTGLVNGTHLLVEDDAVAFAATIVRLLDDRTLRDRLATTARDHIVRAFSEDACYGPLLDLLRRQATAEVQPGIIPAAVEERLQTALKALGMPPVVVWGNGSHTRALMEILERLRAKVRCIADNGATTVSVGPEGRPIVPGKSFAVEPDDLIVLSSQMYETEMWSDLSARRANGARVLALYRRELMTPELKHAYRIQEGRDAPPSMAPRVVQPAGAGSRLVIAEPSAGRSRGPFLRLARSLDTVATRDGIRIVMAGARRASLSGLEPEDRLLLEPAFELPHWSALPEMDDDPWASVVRFARLIQEDFESLAKRLEIGSSDVVMLHTANLIDVLAAAGWLQSQPLSALPEIRLLFHFLPAHEAQWLKVTEEQVVHAYHLVLALLRDRASDRLRVLAQTSALARGLEDVFQCPVEAMGFPVPERLRAASRLDPATPPRLLYAGEARADKGFGLLPAIADALDQELKNGRVRLVCQSMRNEFADDRIRSAARALAERPGVESIDRFLTSAEYDDLVAGCDLVLLPYDAEHYRSRLSAVFVDATCAGVPVIVPAGTWMHAQLRERLGAGATFDSLNPGAIADAVRVCLTTLPSMKWEARDATERAWQRHDPRAVLSTILTTHGAPA